MQVMNVCACVCVWLEELGNDHRDVVQLNLVLMLS